RDFRRLRAAVPPRNHRRTRAASSRQAVKSSSSMNGDAVDFRRAAKPQLHRFARLASRQPTDRQPRAPSLPTTGSWFAAPRRVGSWQAHVTSACLRGKTMRIDSLLTRCAYATMTAIMLLGLGPVAQAQELPSFMAPIAGRTASSPAETATKNVLALNSMMFELYDSAASVFKANLLSKHPVILGLFSGAGGRFILYRPGMAPLEAPSVPVAYQLLKSVGHSTMALSEIVGPYLDNAADQSWRSSMAAYRARIKTA